MNDLWLIGGGGHARSVIDVLESLPQYQIAGVVDRVEKVGEKVLDYPIVASDQELTALVKEDRLFLITVGQIKTPEVRMRLYDTLKKAGGKFATVVSPLAHCSAHAKVGDGTVVLHFALVNAGAKVGCNSIINTRAIIEHDVQIGQHCHISTGAIVNGGAQIGNGVFIGSQTTVKQELTICDNVVVGAHSYVAHDITEKGTYAGAPARLIR